MTGAEAMDWGGAFIFFAMGFAIIVWAVAGTAIYLRDNW